MEEAMRVIDKKTKDLEFSIGVLYDALRDHDTVSLINNDIFKSINRDIEVLNNYQNYYLENINAFFKFALRHFNDTFKNKSVINNSDINSVLNCLNDVKKLRIEINKNNSYNKYFEDIKRIRRNLSGINNDSFLTDNAYTKESLETYEKLLILYENLLNNINELRSDMVKNDFVNLGYELNANYGELKSNLKSMYQAILKSNDDIAEPFLPKLNKALNSGDYGVILDTSMVNKVVDDTDKRSELVGNFEMIISSMDRIIDKYKNKKTDNSNSNIDIEFDSDNKIEDYGIDIPLFIEENYNEQREKEELSAIKNQELYDKKLARLIIRFEILKRKFEKNEKTRGSLTKEEVKLYNRLESELDELKNGKNSSIKFNYYYNKLKKRIKLYKTNTHNIVKEETKKRK